ncbi:hypothetical protein EVAR_34314_1 [Eumeta japonica]|uniref:Uncharacterized protein n=1 Tax=Eumeta variegata TaxID=151549 RepID=A0A4C1VCJ6_EUMVA|nr:hypothetical protein EVAR_34314_1 [Eumeta japonica]
MHWRDGVVIEREGIRERKERGRKRKTPSSPGSEQRVGLHAPLGFRSRSDLITNPLRLTDLEGKPSTLALTNPGRMLLHRSLSNNAIITREIDGLTCSPV